VPYRRERAQALALRLPEARRNRLRGAAHHPERVACSGAINPPLLPAARDNLN
jgi:hypothetical protein